MEKILFCKLSPEAKRIRNNKFEYYLEQHLFRKVGADLDDEVEACDCDGKTSQQLLA